MRNVSPRSFRSAISPKNSHIPSIIHNDTKSHRGVHIPHKSQNNSEIMSP